jgi:hypothetical protein
VVARRPIGLEAGRCRKIGCGVHDIVPVLLVELSMAPLQAGAFEEAQHGAGKRVKLNALVVRQGFDAVQSQPPNSRRLQAARNLHRDLLPVLCVSL